MGDLVFYGGMIGVTLGNQQFTSRNMSFHKCGQAINQAFDWGKLAMDSLRLPVAIPFDPRHALVNLHKLLSPSHIDSARSRYTDSDSGWTYKSITISNCEVGLNLTSGGPSAQAVGSVTFIDSSIENTPIGIVTSYSPNRSSMSNGSLILENVSLTNVGIAVQGASDVTALAGTSGSMTIAAWGQGHKYGPGGHTTFQSDIPPFSRPGGLVRGQQYYERSKPSYANVPVSQFLSARSQGAKGDGIADDTAALQEAINAAAEAGNILFVDAGTYRITKTLDIPAESKILGEGYPVIMSSGPYFTSMQAPQAVVRVGAAGAVGCVEWSDMVVATQGQQAGAILIEWNLAASGTPSGMWDVHTRIGGFKGSKLQLADCPATPAVPSNGTSGGNSSTPVAPFRNATATVKTSSPGPTGVSPLYSNSTGNGSGTDTAYINKACIAAFMSMHITSSAAGLYMENTWLWTADHDLDSTFTNITVYSGRGLYVESEKGNIWLYGPIPLLSYTIIIYT